MTPLDWPDRGVWVPAWLLSAKDAQGNRLPATVRDTWIQMRALAGKNDHLESTWDELEKLMGKSRSPILMHLATLRDRCGLRFRTAGRSTMQVLTFGDGSPILISGIPKTGLLKSGLVSGKRGQIADETGPILKSGLSGNQDSESVVKEESLNLESPRMDSQLTPPEAPILKSGLSGNQDDAMRLAGIPGGDVLERELAACYGSKGQRPPARYKNAQQRDAFAAAAASLGAEFEPLVKAGLARERVALPALLAFLDACVSKRRTGGGPQMEKTNGPRRNDPPGRSKDEPSDEAGRIARSLSGGGAVGNNHGRAGEGG